MPLAVCATPIGNLDDITLRVLEELRAADVVLAEDTRHTRGLLERHEIAATLLSYHEHNEAARVAELVPRLEAGERIALVTDAGMPLVSDPGARLVRAALDAHIPVTVLPGASAVETALVASGLGGGAYAFVGFLPRKAGELEALWRETSSWGCAVVAFESPQRIGRRSVRSPRSIRARGRRVPRADEAVRGGRARLGRRARGALRRAAEGRGDARRRRRASQRPTSPGRSPPWESSSPPVRRAASRPRSSRG